MQGAGAGVWTLLSSDLHIHNWAKTHSTLYNSPFQSNRPSIFPSMARPPRAPEDGDDSDEDDGASETSKQMSGVKREQAIVLLWFHLAFSHAEIFFSHPVCFLPLSFINLSASATHNFAPDRTHHCTHPYIIDTLTSVTFRLSLIDSLILFQVHSFIP